MNYDTVIEIVSKAAGKVTQCRLAGTTHPTGLHVLTVPRTSRDDASRRRITLAIIAAEAGVSLPTVSKVVNRRPDVAAATRAKVERLLDEHHYLRAGTRRQRRSGLIDLVFNGLDSPWAVEILRGVEEWGASHETGVAVSAVRHGNARPASWTSTLASHDTDGVILVTSELTQAQLEQLRSGGIPLVVVDPVNPPPPELASVGATNWAGGLAATEHLLNFRHRRIAAIAGPEDYLCSRARIDGYRSALERAGSDSIRRWSGTATSSTRAVSGAAASCWTWPTARPPSSRAATSRPWASTRRPGSAACGSRRT